MEIEIHLPRPTLDYYCKVSSVQELSENKAKEIVTHKNIKYVITGFCSSGEKGFISCSAKEVVPAIIYKGSLKPLSYAQCHVEVEKGNRERGYNAQLFKYDGKEYVTISGKTITFKPTDEGTQLEFFNI